MPVLYLPQSGGGKASRAVTSAQPEMRFAIRRSDELQEVFPDEPVGFQVLRVHA